MDDKKYKAFYTAFIALALIAGLLFGVRLIADSQYTNIKEPKTIPEVHAMEEVNDAFRDDERVYVFYQQIACVNVYDLDGKFLWAVHAPVGNYGAANAIYDDEFLYFYQDEVYTFRLSDGQLAGKLARTDDEEYPDDFGGIEMVDDGDAENGEIYFDDYSVYRGNVQGGFDLFVHRGGWRLFFDFTFDGALFFFSLVSLLITYLISARKKRRSCLPV